MPLRMLGSGGQQGLQGHSSCWEHFLGWDMQGARQLESTRWTDVRRRVLQRETALGGRHTGPRRTMVNCWARSPMQRGYASTVTADSGQVGLHSAWGSVGVGG